VALVHPDLDRETEEILADVLKVSIQILILPYSNFASGGAGGVHGGVDVKLFWNCIGVILVKVKVSRGTVPFSPMGIDSADTGQPPNGEICMGKSHLLPNNPARQ
jgi:hypothetical protein